jgi:hypothetical protein
MMGGLARRSAQTQMLPMHIATSLMAITMITHIQKSESSESIA